MSTDEDLDLSTGAIVLASLLSSLPALAALLVIGAADLTLEGWALYVVIGLAVVGMFVGEGLLERSATGAAARGAHRRMMATLSPLESKVHDVARYAPIAVALLVFVLWVPGGAGGSALGLVAGYAVAQLAFAIWLHGRRDEFSPAPSS